MSATVTLSRGFSMPQAQFSGLSNPLAISNLYGKGGRSHQGEEKGVSFSLQVGRNESEVSQAKQGARSGAEHYAKVRMANKEGYVPVVVTFDLSEQTFPLLQGKLGIPRKITIGQSEIVEVDPILSFNELQTHHDGEIIVQAGSLTPEQLQQLHIEIGTAQVGKEGQRVQLVEAITSKAEFSYKPFENPSTLPEGPIQSIGETGGLLK